MASKQAARYAVVPYMAVSDAELVVKKTRVSVEPGCAEQPAGMYGLLPRVRMVASIGFGKPLSGPLVPCPSHVRNAWQPASVVMR